MSQLVRKTDYVAEDNQVFETHLDKYLDKHGLTCYNLIQSNNGLGAISGNEETVCLNGDQAVVIAKTILRNEGYNIE